MVPEKNGLCGIPVLLDIRTSKLTKRKIMPAMLKSLPVQLMMKIVCVALMAATARAEWKTLLTGGSVSYTNSFSEENGGWSGVRDTPIAGIVCHGSYCDNKQLIVLVNGDDPVQHSGDVFTQWFTDQGSPSEVDCPNNMVVNEVQCRGGYCDDIRFRCGYLKQGYRGVSGDLRESGWFSEEEGERRCRDGYYLWGMKCSGAYCDAINLICARIDYDDGTVTDDGPPAGLNVEGYWQFVTVASDMDSWTKTVGTRYTDEQAKTIENWSQHTVDVKATVGYSGNILTNGASYELSLGYSGSWGSRETESWRNEFTVQEESSQSRQFSDRINWNIYQWRYKATNGPTTFTTKSDIVIITPPGCQPRCLPGHSLTADAFYQECVNGTYLPCYEGFTGIDGGDFGECDESSMLPLSDECAAAVGIADDNCCPCS